MRSGGLILVLLLQTSVASAEVVRVAVTHGSRVVVEGTHLVLRGGGPEAVEAEGSIALEAVGPFVSTGSRLDARFTIEEATGGPLRLNGIPVIGAAEVAADKSGLAGIDAIDLERYVASVVGREMPASWPAAALEAQAIAARSYVLARRRTSGDTAPYDVEATVRSQAYGGESSISPRSVAAAEATRGQVVFFDGAPATTFFFASCAGMTERASDAFGAGAPYLRSVACGTTSDEDLGWQRRLPWQRLSSLLRRRGTIGADLRAIDVVTRTPAGRAATLRMQASGGARTIRAAELRQIVGADLLPSLDFQIERQGADVVFAGRGSGHAVGLCQRGARDMALGGATAAAILSHYYPGTRLGLLPATASEEKR
jgi:stage II sporulation protein D